jgi:crotonobetainyl-CoA:carnitine CoA-transferase CaiB-like acyl-CoA transferase
VLEVGERLGAAAAGLALTALGAEVAQVRLPSRRIPKAEATYYDRGRLALAGPEARDLGRLANSCEVIVSDLDTEGLHHLGLPAAGEDLSARGGPPVLVSIRPFGRTGPSAGYRMTDLTDWAASGLATVTRRPLGADLADYTPVVPPGFQPQALAGLAAATGAFAGLRSARNSGQAVVVDVSVQEVMVATLHSIFPPFVWNNHVLGHPSTPGNAFGLLLPAADGDVYIRTVETHQWDRLINWLGDPDWRHLGEDPYDRLANLGVIASLAGEWTSGQRRDDLLVDGQRRKVPIALPRSLEDVLRWQHLRARGAWRAIDFDGRNAEVARIPLLEPDSWNPTVEGTVSELAERWGGR